MRELALVAFVATTMFIVGFVAGTTTTRGDLIDSTRTCRPAFDGARP